MSGLLTLLFVLSANGIGLAFASPFVVFGGSEKIHGANVHHLDVYTDAGRLTIISEGRTVLTFNLEHKICNPCTFHTIDMPKLHGDIKVRDSLGHSQVIHT